MANALLDADLPVDSTPVAVAAEQYARMGLAPIPLHSVVGGRCTCQRAECGRASGKHPVAREWQRLATTELDTVRDQFRDHRGNIGIMLGRDLVVLDVDGDEGFVSLQALGPLPPTLTSMSGSGEGQHLVFRYAPGQDPDQVTNRRVAQGLDVKTRAGQIVVAPSIHASGRRYQWSVRVPPAELPWEVYEQIRKPVVVPLRRPADTSAPAATGSLYERARAYLAKVDPAVAGQGGHAQTFAAARALAGWVAKGLGRHDAWALLCDYNRRCSPPWSERELRHKLDQALTAARVVPELPDRAPLASPTTDDATTTDAPNATASTAATAATAATAVLDDWRVHLIYDAGRHGARIAKHSENVAITLRFHPEWSGKVRWNEFANVVEVMSPPWHDTTRPRSEDTDRPRAWTDSDTSRLSGWIRRELNVDMSVSDCDRAVIVAAEMDSYHPVREWLSSLQWDGVQRLRHAAARYLGAEPTPYVEAVFRWWMISAVARSYVPGAKADNMIILEGPQGLKKSTALRVLAGDEWFSDTPLDLHSKDAYLALQGRLIVELAELDAFRGAEWSRIKAFLSSPSDTYRRPYGRRNVTVPRGCVFAGTTNFTEYLNDPTGKRRFWPIACTSIDLDALREDREQLWAEAVSEYLEGHVWWPDTPEERAMCGVEQETRAEVDSWESRILTWIQRSGTEDASTGEILEYALGIEPARWTRADQMRVGAIAIRLGWEKLRRRVGAGREWRYRFATPPP